MSRSPDGPGETSSEYSSGWAAIYRLIRQGRSWSGFERHVALLNTGGGRFSDVSAVSGFDRPEDGRGLAVVDWDRDGRLDVWTTSRSGPRLRFLHNRGPATSFLAVRLRGRSGSRDAIGARAELRRPGAPTLVRVLAAGDGYLSQSSKWLHFGLGVAADTSEVLVRWPGGQPEAFGGLEADRHYLLEEGSGRAVEVPRPAAPPATDLAVSEPSPPPTSARSRVRLAARIPLPGLAYTRADGTRAEIAGPADGRARLVSLWASWCAACRQELRALAPHASSLAAAGLDVVVLSVEPPDDRAAPAFLEKIDWPGERGHADGAVLDVLEILQGVVLDRPRPLALPTSLLFDGAGRLAVIYRGPVEVAMLEADRAEVTASAGDPEADRAAAVPEGAGGPASGRWLGPPPAAPLVELANRLRQHGYVDMASSFLTRIEIRHDEAAPPPPWVAERLAASQVSLGADLAAAGRHGEAAAAFRRALEIAPDDVRAHEKLGISLHELGEREPALHHLREAIRLDPDSGTAHYHLGLVLVAHKRLDEAVEAFTQAVRRAPGNAAAHYNLGAVLGQQKRYPEAIEHLRNALAARRDYFEAHRALGSALHALGRPREAIPEYEAALRLEPEHETTICNLGLAYASIGDLNKARKQHARLVIRNARLAARLEEAIRRRE